MPCTHNLLRLFLLRLLAGVFAIIGALSVLPASAQTLTPFPPGQSLVFLAEGVPTGNPTGTQLYQAVQTVGTLTFTPIGPPSPILYNSIGFDSANGFIYGFEADTGNLVQIGSDGTAEVLGPVAGLPSGLASAGWGLNAGAFGGGGDAGTLYVREDSNTTGFQYMWAVNIATQTATQIQLSQPVPDLHDMTYSAGYLWSVYATGEGDSFITIYRIDPDTGAVSSFVALPATENPTPSTGAVVDQPYGAQWTYSNGNIGILGKDIGVAYQIAISNPSGNPPSFRIVSAQTAPPSAMEDGTAEDTSAEADLSLEKKGQITAWDTANHVYDVEYTFTVTNNGPAPSSGSIITDVLPEAFSIDPDDIPGNCLIAEAYNSDGSPILGSDSGEPLEELTCNVGPLEVNGRYVMTVTGTIPDNADLSENQNVATVIGNESDPDESNNESNSGVLEAPPPPPQPASGAIGAVTPVPALDARALALLAVLMGGLAWFIRRKVGR
ncbi:MAG: DUF11 domain-containing protein [Burkholderiaceae bacterium]|jgi:hypothetical protein|nr:DUF11 domain-containing protein [Burkholderiaceae bacterium]